MKSIKVFRKSPALCSARDFVFLAHDALVVLLLLLERLQRKSALLGIPWSFAQHVDLAESLRCL